MPNIWIADLAAYNAGFMVGEWVEVTGSTTVDEVQVAIDRILANGARELIDAGEYSGPHEEFAIHDYENFGPIEIGEYTQIDEVIRLAGLVDDDPNKLGAFVAYHGIHYVDNFDPDNVIGPLGDSMKDVAYDVVEESGYLDQMPDFLKCYFDYEAFARDLEIEGNYVYFEGQYYELVD